VSRRGVVVEAVLIALLAVLVFRLGPVLYHFFEPLVR